MSLKSFEGTSIMFETRDVDGTTAEFGGIIASCGAGNAGCLSLCLSLANK
jgi:hypothetical protein